jgi:hypothetical protein
MWGWNRRRGTGGMNAEDALRGRCLPYVKAESVRGTVAMCAEHARSSAFSEWTAIKGRPPLI